MNRYHSFTDPELTDLLENGNHAAFTEIYNRYWKKLFIVAAQKIKDLEEAEEIVQHIFVSLWNRRTSLKITSSLSAYLAVSVKYRVIKALDKQYHQQKYTDSLGMKGIADDSTQEWLDFSELKDRLEKLVGSLPEKCQLVYRMSKEQGLSQKQIAEELVISEKTVEAHLSKAMKTLRAGLNQFMLMLL
ncbi:RNA polymerase sigma-70 factor [Pedobacter gandavensis]|uniref:RNA polymerase sigma-70 factor n=1 Tax=Pedobacter gandavensis TaxID=2679963 RepID=UPI0029311311|nr:RNA polymerase sigma-70 factor [Pedobacter gandavensis]